MLHKLKISVFLLIILILPFVSIYPIKALEPSGNFLIVNGGTIRSLSDNETTPTSFYFDILIKPNSVSGQRQILTITDSSSSETAYQIGINGGSLSFIQRYGSSAFRSISAGNIAANSWQR